MLIYLIILIKDDSDQRSVLTTCIVTAASPWTILFADTETREDVRSRSSVVRRPVISCRAPPPPAGPQGRTLLRRDDVARQRIFARDSALLASIRSKRDVAHVADQRSSSRVSLCPPQCRRHSVDQSRQSRRPSSTETSTASRAGFADRPSMPPADPILLTTSTRASGGSRVDQRRDRPPSSGRDRSSTTSVRSATVGRLRARAMPSCSTTSSTRGCPAVSTSDSTARGCRRVRSADRASCRESA